VNNGKWYQACPSAAEKIGSRRCSSEKSLLDVEAERRLGSVLNADHVFRAGHDFS